MLFKKKYVHPFPARMAPEIAISALSDLNAGDVVLDPMTGSGTVLHHAALKNFQTVGFDVDPLAVLMSKVGTSKINLKRLRALSEKVLSEVKTLKLNQIELPWMDKDQETLDFVEYWFAVNQKNDLRKIAYVLNDYKKLFKRIIEIDVLRIALSRIIITKKVGASLAWDISHSRPHKVRDENEYNVIDGFEKSIKDLTIYLEFQEEIGCRSKISLGDARNLKLIKDRSIDKVITSPPYLNAIDYMRGHKFSLIWLGYSIAQLRAIRTNAVGVERKISSMVEEAWVSSIYKTILTNDSLSNKHKGMIKLYIYDSMLLMSEIARVLKPGKTATLVVGNSNLNGHYIDNSEVFNQAGAILGLTLNRVVKREIPLSKRYLPVPKKDVNALGNRMRYEMVMTFVNSMSN